jgi:hypothetical protein
VHNAAHLLFGVNEAFSPEEVIRAFDINAVGALQVNRGVLHSQRGTYLWRGKVISILLPR